MSITNTETNTKYRSLLTDFLVFKCSLPLVHIHSIQNIPSGNMEAPQKPKLRIWARGWGLESIDPGCLSVLTYARFKKMPLDIQECTPASSVTGSLPELLVEESVFASPLNIIGICRREKYNADYNLSKADQADTLAFTALIEQKLQPGLQSCFWLNSANYANVTRKAFAKGYGLIRRYIDLPMICNKVKTDLQLRSPQATTDIESYWNQEAKMCITLLSKRLGECEYFFGSNPTTFDAIAFGHLSVLLKAPLASTELKNHLLACDNLCKFCDRISRRYFQVIGYCDDKEQKKQPSEESIDDENASRNFKIALAIGIMANVLFALKRNLPSMTSSV